MLVEMHDVKQSTRVAQNTITVTYPKTPAIHQGTPARTTTPPAPLLGLLSYTEDEERAVAEVIRSRSLCSMMGAVY